MKKKNAIFALVLTTGLTIGFALPNKAFGFDSESGKCWSAQLAGDPGDGYYKCRPAGGCDWVSGAVHDGDSSNCGTPE